MKPILLLVDLQRDYLRSPGLEPAAGLVTAQASRLLRSFRDLALPVVHVWTTVDRGRDQRMPHWRRMGKWQCEEGTDGHRPPAELQPLPGEAVVHKRFFGAFGTGELERVLNTLEADTLLLAGVHLHACVRASALDAYERGYRVWIADDAVASDDPLHAAITRRYLQERAAEFNSVDHWLRELGVGGSREPAASGDAEPPPLPVAIIGNAHVHRTNLCRITRQSPAREGFALATVPVADAAAIGEATGSARRAARDWAHSDPAARVRLLDDWADRIDADAGLAAEIARETGKPIRHARDEVAATAIQLRAIARRVCPDEQPGQDAPAWVRHRALGVIAVVTPWNNPTYIPAGKIGAALLHGNTVVWKPAPAASTVAVRLMRLLQEGGAPDGSVNLVLGDRSVAAGLMADPGVDAVTLTGSTAAGYAAQDICARRHVPLQAELGGNNAAIVWADADLAIAAERIAEGAFAMAGQRCTANRRVIVDERCRGEFLGLLAAAVARLGLGDSMDPGTQVGPLISRESRDRVAACVARARSRGLGITMPHGTSGVGDPCGIPGTEYFPTLVLADDPRDELVQEETFGPVLVVQRAANWAEAISRCNGVRQGLAAALFSGSPELQRCFLAEARAGILKINRSTAGAAVDVPFGGWKASGIGPPEHGSSDREFHTRVQAIYR
ncbi:MAG: aldehyde dehydrogenase family protein [Verrucomicrobia bacterium]|nr:MAG: aldehyde dehydrogenase family protein [Verrucomicrobiota bacterium]